MNKVWKEHERDFIRNNANILKDREIAVKLAKISGRTITEQAVRKQRQKMKIKKARVRGICEVVDGTTNQSTNIGRAVATGTTKT